MPDQPFLDARRTSLLVLDYQHGIVQQLSDADGLLNRVNAAIAGVRSHGGHVAWVRAALDDADFDAIPESSVMAPRAAPQHRLLLHADAPTTRIDERLVPQPDDMIVRRPRIGAFTTSDLDEQLRSRDVTTVILAGIVTSGVLLSTVFEALDRDYRVVVLHDASGDRDPQVHEFLTEKIFPRYTVVVSADELNSLWLMSSQEQAVAEAHGDAPRTQ
ncbi:cysteine hydrolase family protein [Streptomyces sp. BBFR51]|uniref:cysteine hydrolase family protein n=1 Tax=Streptomyces sp. BBFR51 TaxID=3372856 RepID=UPI0037DC595A